MPAPSTVATFEPITSTHENTVVGQFTLAHVEWTASSGSVASGGTSSIGTLTYDAATSNVATTALATISSNTLTIVESGVYDLAQTGTIGTAPTGVTYLGVSDGTNNYRVPGVTPSALLGGAIFSGARLPAGTVLTFTFYHTSAANRTLTSRTMLTKIGYY